MASSTTTARRARRASFARTDFFGQPRALAPLFGVEMWERFSFYGMQGILALYLFSAAGEGGLGVPESTALGLVGAYGGAVYLSTIVGAWVSDRILGAERVLLVGAFTIMIGHLALALIPGVPGLLVGLTAVAVGSGALKATASAIVGKLYSTTDERRDAGFSIFYLGINLGALLGPLITGIVQSSVGFHWGFGVSGLGMALGLAQYVLSRRHLPAAVHVVANPLPAARRTLVCAVAFSGAAIIGVSAATGLLRPDSIVTIIVVVAAGASIAYFAVLLRSSRVNRGERRRVLAFIPLFMSSVVFWALYQQQFTVLAAYSHSRLDRNLFGWEMPVAWVQSINPIFIILLSAGFAALWTAWGPRQPSTPVKFSAAVIGMGIAFLLFLPMAGGGDASAPLPAIVGILFLFTVAELMLSPVGLSVATKLAPKAFQAQMMALFFLAASLGTALSGQLATFYSSENEVAYFGVLGVVSLLAGVLLLLARPWTLRMMGGVR